MFIVVGLHLIVKCYYSLATNSIHGRDVATNYIHLRAKEKMSAFQNDRDQRSPLSSRSNCPQTLRTAGHANASVKDSD